MYQRKPLANVGTVVRVARVSSHYVPDSVNYLGVQRSSVSHPTIKEANLFHRFGVSQVSTDPIPTSLKCFNIHFNVS